MKSCKCKIQVSVLMKQAHCTLSLHWMQLQTWKQNLNTRHGATSWGHWKPAVAGGEEIIWNITKLAVESPVSSSLDSVHLHQAQQTSSWMKQCWKACSLKIRTREIPVSFASIQHCWGPCTQENALQRTQCRRKDQMSVFTTVSNDPQNT